MQRYAELHFDLESAKIAVDKSLKELMGAVNTLMHTYQKDENLKMEGKKVTRHPTFDTAARSAVSASLTTIIGALRTAGDLVSANQGYIESVCPSMRQPSGVN